MPGMSDGPRRHTGGRAFSYSMFHELGGVNTGRTVDELRAECGLPPIQRRAGKTVRLFQQILEGFPERRVGENGGRLIDVAPVAVTSRSVGR